MFVKYYVNVVFLYIGYNYGKHLGIYSLHMFHQYTSSFQTQLWII